MGGTHALKQKYKDFKLMLLARYPMCEVCNIAVATQVDHALYHVHGGKFDSIENCRSCCPACNTGYGDNANARLSKKAHWKKRCEELGRGHMLQWNSQIPKWRREGFE